MDKETFEETLLKLAEENKNAPNYYVQVLSQIILMLVAFSKTEKLTALSAVFQSLQSLVKAYKL